MEVVKTIASNGRVMFFHVVDGKKKRISKEVAEKSAKVPFENKSKSSVSKKGKTKPDKAKKEEVTQKQRDAFWKAVFDDPTFIKRALDFYRELAREGLTADASAVYGFYVDAEGKIRIDMNMLEPAKNGKMNLEHFFMHTLDVLQRGTLFGENGLPKMGGTRDQYQKIFAVGTNILEWLAEKKPKTTTKISLFTELVSLRKDIDLWEADEEGDVVDDVKIVDASRVKQWKIFVKKVLETY